jgi:uncharacterized membrane protein YhhN
VSASTPLFLAAVAVSAACAIVAAHRGDRPGFYLFKPLTTIIILIGAAWIVRPAPPLYRALVVAGLGCSLGGDILLMLRGDRIAAGVAAFLLAHLGYVVAFSVGNPVSFAQVMWLLPFVAFCGAVLGDRWRALGRLKVPLAIYTAVLCTMAWRAAMRGQAIGIPRQTFLFGVAGACLFVVSDAILVLRRFGRPFAAAQSLELGTYWVAQTLIALSVRGSFT